MMESSRTGMALAALGGSGPKAPRASAESQAPPRAEGRCGPRPVRKPPSARAWAAPEMKGVEMRKISLVLLGATAGAALALLATQARLALTGSAANAAAMEDIYRQLSLFGDVFERVRADYVEKPDDTKLIQTAINGMLSGLDPHSSYMDPNGFREMQVETHGELGRLRIEVTIDDRLVNA